MLLFLVLVWRGFYYGYSLFKADEVGATSELPYYPFAFVLAFSGIPVILLIFDKFINTIKNRDNR